MRAEEPILSFLLSSPILGPLTYPAFYGIWLTLEITRATGHVRVDLMLHRCHAAGGLLSATFPPAIRWMPAEVPAPCAHDQKIVQPAATISRCRSSSPGISSRPARPMPHSVQMPQARLPPGLAARAASMSRT